MKRILSSIMIIIMAVSIFYFKGDIIKAGNSLGFTWQKNDTMNESLQIVKNKSGKDEVFLKFNYDQFGDYKIKYNLHNNEYTEITLNRESEKTTISYGIFKDDDNTSLLQAEIDKTYQEVDYTAALPVWETVTGKKANVEGLISFEINTGDKYLGKSFMINNIKVQFKWDPQGKKIYFLTSGVDAGKIIPFTLTAPSTDTNKLNILRNLEEFDVSPIHLINYNGTNEKIVKIDTEDPMSADEVAGGRPGMEITFKQPYEYDENENKFVKSNSLDTEAVATLSEVSGMAYTDFRFKLATNDAPDNDTREIVNSPDEGYVYDNPSIKTKYKYTDEKYSIQIVKDKSELNNKEEIIQWSDLEASRIYSVNISFDAMDNFEFAPYKPENNYGYTFINYSAQRASLEDAYLSVIPYAGLDNSELEYTVYRTDAKPDEFTESDIWLTHHVVGSDDNQAVYIPIPYEKSNEKYYGVSVEFASADLKSQILVYRPINDENVPPPTPRIKSLQNFIAVPSIEVDGEPQKVQFDLEWEAPINSNDNPVLKK